MSEFSRNAARFSAAIAATLFLVSCGGSDETPSPPPFGATTLVLGSSISDNGNQCQARPSECLPTPPAYNQLDSNGPLWVNTVAARYGAAVNPSLKGGTNFAYADARTGVVPSFGTTKPSAPIAPSLVEQTEAMLARNGYTINPQNLVIVEATGAFSNSTQAGLELVLANPTSAATIGNSIVVASLTDVVGIVNRLYAAGARNILLLNSGDMSKSVAARALAQSQTTAPLVGLLSQMSTGFNSNLATQLNNVKAVSPGLNVYLLDVFSWQNEIVANPAAFGIANVTQPCVIWATATTPQVVCSTDPAVQNTYFFWDTGSHPTYATGQLLAQRAIATIGR